MTDDPTLRQALATARRGWPVFPCLPGQKIPATQHGFRDATTDPDQITDWFTRHPDHNLAIATGAPGPDVLDVDQHSPAENGYPALGCLRRAGLLDGAAAYVRTPSGGLHAYFTGTAQRNGHLPAHHLDFLSSGGYILAPPSQVDGHRYQLIEKTGRHGSLGTRVLPVIQGESGGVISAERVHRENGPAGRCRAAPSGRSRACLDRKPVDTVASLPLGGSRTLTSAPQGCLLQ